MCTRIVESRNFAQQMWIVSEKLSAVLPEIFGCSMTRFGDTPHLARHINIHVFFYGLQRTNTPPFSNYVHYL